MYLKNLISVSALKALGLVISIRDGILKMTKGSMVIMKGVRWEISTTRRVVRLQVKRRLLVLQMMVAKALAGEGRHGSEK